MGYIFESEIETIMNTVRARTIGESDGIKLKEILAADIHPAVKAYFKAEVEKHLQEEREKEVRSKRFPYGLPEVAGLQRQIDLLLVNQYQFDQQEFESLLDSAVHFEFNFLCRPQWTLQEFMFENRRTVGVREAIRKFKYCVEYTYLVEIFKRYVVDRGLAEMNYEEFRKLISSIDREVVGRHSSGELARLLKPMLEFLEVGIPETRISDTGPVLPINAAIVFFEDKKMEDIQKKLESERDQKKKQEISLNDLAAMIAELRNEPLEAPIVDLPKAPSLDLPMPDPVPVPVKKTLEQKPVLKPKEPELAPRKPKAARKPLRDIYSLFTVKEQKLFVKKLFKKDEIEFRNALDRLNPIETWKEATDVLEMIFNTNDVDPFSREAIQLTDKLHGRYGNVNQKKQ